MAMQTCVVVAIGVFGATLGSTFQCVLLVTAFAAALLLLAVFKPFVNKEANLIGMLSCGCLLITAQAPLVFALLRGEEESGGLAASIVAVIVLLVNIVFVSALVWRLVRAVDWQRVGESLKLLVSKAGCSKGK